MNPHTCATLVDGCFRCELNRDELESWADTLRVSAAGVVHDADCTNLTRRPTETSRWSLGNRYSTDRACKRCLPDGLPVVAVSA